MLFNLANYGFLITLRQVEFGIASLTRKQASPLRVLQIRRTHCGGEPGLHHRHDVTLREDADRRSVGNTGIGMASTMPPKPDVGLLPIFPMLLPCSHPPIPR